MSQPLKDLYSPAFYDSFSRAAAETIPAFDRRKFIRAIFDAQWQDRELKERMKHTSSVLHRFLPAGFEKASASIRDIIIHLRHKGIRESSLEYMFLPDYIETYGLDHFDVSVNSFEFVTTFTSCEFAVRPFIIKYGDRMLARMLDWTRHENHHVRRLASEGSRPRLPWAMAIPALKKDPQPILPILGNLKNDPSEYVRRSVANSLNDISKDHPRIVIAISKKWTGISRETDALVKHACRTLLKQGNAGVLKHFGFGGNARLEVPGLKLHTPVVRVPGALEFSFTIKNNDRKPKTVRMEYAVHYLRKNGQLSRKVFKISEREFQPGEAATIKRRQSFRPITTRRFYPGQQGISLIINGQERHAAKFELKT